MTISLPIFTTRTEVVDRPTGLHIREHTGMAPVEDILVAKLLVEDAEENAANALLFVAAPKLFFALRDIVESTADLDEPHREAAHAALREAIEGE